MKALIAMSGGVDSSVAAQIMASRGYECVGCTMRLYENDVIGKDLLDTCCSLENTQPNPCIECNRCLKFEHLFSKMKELGCDVLATGHYARTKYDPERGRYLLMKALDPAKDQSYVLYVLTQEQLAHVQFPLGDQDKNKTRVLGMPKSTTARISALFRTATTPALSSATAARSVLPAISWMRRAMSWGATRASFTTRSASAAGSVFRQRTAATSQRSIPRPTLSHSEPMTI